MKPVTEESNPKAKDIDRRSTIEIVRLINEEDKTVADAVSLVLDSVAAGVDLIVERLKSGGQLIYVGTGTSGRLGVLDASECRPTFGVSADLVRGVIAGGYDALHRSVEAAEDDPEQAARDLQSFGISSRDAVSIASSPACAIAQLSTKNLPPVVREWPRNSATTSPSVPHTRTS